MNWFYDMRIGSRLIGSFLIMIVMAIVIGLVGMNSGGKVADALQAMYDDNFVAVGDVANANMQAIYYDRALYDIVIEEDPAEMKKINERADQNIVKLTQLMEKYKKTFLIDKEKDAIKRFDAAWPVYLETAKKIRDLMYAKNSKEAIDLLNNKATKQFQVVDDILSEIVDINIEIGAKANTAGKQLVERSKLIAIGLLLGVIVAGITLAILITRSITRPMQEAMTVAETIASGDLTYHIEATSRDEIGDMLRALKEMNGSLLRIVSEVRTSTDTIATASSQIAAGNLDLSSRTEQQAASLEESASSMEELTSTVRQNADNAKQANQMVVSASDYAVKGGQVVEQMVGTMGSIKESSRKIVDIIGVIDGIAFQTNILALNAAVEAARAGEQGRGFAVVASEVRSLAQRSAAAAKEIKELIGASVENVDAGGRLVDETGQTMSQIVTAVKQVADIMSEIAAASAEQSSGIEQVNTAIAQMDEVTQQNAALVEEAAAASSSMQDQAGKLAETVAVFKLVPGTHTSSIALAKPAKSSKTSKVSANKATSVKRQALTNQRSTHDQDWDEF